MRNDSMRLVFAGGMIALLVLSAAAWRAVRGPLPTPAEPPVSAARPLGDSAGDPQSAASRTEAAFAEAAVPILAEEPDGAGPFLVALRVTEAIRGEKLFLCDSSGCPLEEIVPDRDGDQTLGPLAPGRYVVCRGETEIGAFRLRGNAALSEAGGRLWTDGELLHVERFVPGVLRLELTLPKPGYYSFRLCDRVGREWSRELFIPEREQPNREQAYGRSLEFRGLPAGAYTLVWRDAPVGRAEVAAGETAFLEFAIDN